MSTHAFVGGSIGLRLISDQVSEQTSTVAICRVVKAMGCRATSSDDLDDQLKTSASVNHVATAAATGTREALGGESDAMGLGRVRRGGRQHPLGTWQRVRSDRRIEGERRAVCGAVRNEVERE